MHLFGHAFDHDYYFELARDGGAGYPINYSVFIFTPSRFPGFPACEPNLLNCASAFAWECRRVLCAAN